MMRKHMSLIIGGVVALLLACVLAFLLWQKIGAYSVAREDLGLATTRLGRLTRRAIFPSEDNKKALGEQVLTFSDYLDELEDNMREGQFASPALNRSQFAGLYEDMLSRMEAKAAAKSVSIPPGFAFGFQRYAGGSIPAAEEVDRLVVQLDAVEQICNKLMEAGIATLLTVERPVFEASAQVAEPEENVRRRPVRRGADEAPQANPLMVPLFESPDGLFTRERYVFSFRAKDEALAAVLDTLAEDEPFTVVTHLEIANPAKPAVVLPKSAEEPAATSVGAAAPVSANSRSRSGSATAARGASEQEILPRELRVVAGKEIPAIRMAVDVYRFRAPETNGQEEPS